ncbi:MAG TPA: hypothetical protein VEX13_02690 [Chloroflexia bacterium]|nr:hypothetical protein [Chloroflexia bacterium]
MLSAEVKPGVQPHGTPNAPTSGSVPQANKAKRTRVTALAALLTLALFAMLLSGCGITISDRSPAPTATPQRPSNVAEAPNTQETHDLSIAAIDFDPALDPQLFIMGKPYSLLVAVENKGNRKEGPFTVSAQLLTQDRQKVLLSQQRTITRLSAGDVTVARFPSSTTPPRERVYVLQVQIQAVPGESNTGNNKRTLEIQLNTTD